MAAKEISSILKASSVPTATEQLNVTVGGEAKKAFLQHGFYKSTEQQILHMHSYAEVHVFLGKARIMIDSEEKLLSGATLVVVPKGVYHSFYMSGSARHSAFQIDLDLEVSAVKISEDLAREFFTELTKCLETESHSKISAFISFLCSYFYKNDKVERAKKITDYAFLINDFFSLRYTDDVKVSDLADELCVSEKQAHRLVVRYMGRTFGQELTSRRMKAAEHLMRDGKISLTDIAESVGFQTYSGFWKAYKRYKASTDSPIEDSAVNPDTNEE